MTYQLSAVEYKAALEIMAYAWSNHKVCSYPVTADYWLQGLVKL